MDRATLRALGRVPLGDIKVDAHERDDLIQDALLKVLADPPLAKVREPVSYLRMVMRNLLVDRIRQQVRRACLSDTLMTLVGPSRDDTARTVEAQEQLMRVNDAVEALSPRCGEAFRLHRVEQLTYAQIARHMKISVSAVEKHVAEALYRIASVLDDGHEPNGR